MQSLLNVTPYLVIDRIVAIRRPQIWRNESGRWLLKKSQCRMPCVQVCYMSCWKTRYRLTHRASWATSAASLRQEHGHVAVIAAVDLHSWMDKDDVHEARPWDADGHHNRSTKRRSGAQLVANLNFWLSTSSAATHFRYYGISYMGFVYNLLLFPAVKEFWKSVGFWQSYQHQLCGPICML